MKKNLLIIPLVLLMACSTKKESAEVNEPEDQVGLTEEPNLDFKGPIQGTETMEFLNATGFARGAEGGSVRLAVLSVVDGKYVYKPCEDVESKRIIFEDSSIASELLPVFEFTTDDDYRYDIIWIDESEKNNYIIAYSFITDSQKTVSETVEEGRVVYTKTPEGKGFWLLQVNGSDYISKSDIPLFQTIEEGC